LKARVAEAIKAAGCGRVFNNLELDDAILEDIGVYGDDRKLFVRGFQLAANLNAIAHVESVMPTREEFVKSFEMACKDPHTPSWWMGFLRGYDSFKIELLRRLGSGT
jgi:dTDP-4-dehydrorhamnose 3,5-epimerase-like enzyme